MRFRNSVCLSLTIAVAVLPCLITKWHERTILIEQFLALFTLLGCCVVLLAIPPLRRGVRCLGAVARRLQNVPDRWFIAVVAGLFFGLTGYLSHELFCWLPHIPDSQILFMQSKLLAAGHFYVPSHPLREFFDIQHVMNDGKYYGMYPPGHPLLLMLGQLIGLPWMVNPALGALFVVAVYYLGCETGTPATGRVAALLTLSSPFVVFMSSEYMSHASALLALTLFVLFYIRMLKNRRWQDALCSGLAMGYLGITRPQCVVFASIFLLAHAAVVFITQFRRFGRLYLTLAAGGIPFVAFLMYYNFVTTGDPLVTGYQKMGGSISGTWLTLWRGWHALLYMDLARVGIQVGVLNEELFCWAIPSLTFVVILFLFHAEKRYSWLLAMTFFSVSFGLTLTGYSALRFFGPRYLYETSGVLIALTALGVQRVPLIARAMLPIPIDAPTWRGLLIAVCVVLAFQGLFNRSGYLYSHYRTRFGPEGTAGYYLQIVRNVQPPALVFVADDQQFRNVSFTMPPDDNASIIFAHDLGDKNESLMAYYPGRNVYRADVDEIRQLTDATIDHAQRITSFPVKLR